MASWNGRLRPWWRRGGDALSRLVNTVLFNGSPAESVSGRSHREPWPRLERFIDSAFRLFGEVDHCRRTHERDLAQAQELLDEYEE